MEKKEEQLSINGIPDDQTVVDYLLENPNFFIRNARAVEQIRVPHPVRETVSLVEWYMSRQRARIACLEEDITLLMERARVNEQLFEQLFKLLVDLFAAESLQDMLGRLNSWAKNLGLNGAAIRLFSDKWHIGAPFNAPDLALSRNAFEPIRIRRFGNNNHYLGMLNGPESLLLLPQIRHVGSVAVSLLGARGELGMVMFNSRNHQHYQEGMGTDMLDHLAKLLPDMLSRWIKRI
ncbi:MULTISPECIES: DUF484 domain-containing protein [Photorhabdus]|uniref:DUF484 domain-containing protein n=2 Tax=Photorhabdus asymbiotica TaxID=291112 RepID=B6VLR3_PHOAA|nr:DUF484 domain-containing protein [Photorhabdus asymbiotica]RKS60048.1 hypothetical protein BDD30_2164 [Photorhabdus asymbiotica]CAQ86208.1 conserved hypothetical protein [Photorhabdus asymbiotica]CAR67093.1 similar to unknown protein yiga of escherichia coli [Photorhabdus asymbiotica subsp. asymbiotica ATCC 43949]